MIVVYFFSAVILLYLIFGMLAELMKNKFISWIFCLLAIFVGLCGLRVIVIFVLYAFPVAILFIMPLSLWLLIMTKPFFHEIRVALKIKPFSNSQ